MKVGELSGMAWRKSSHSGSTGGDCVEVARLGVSRLVRDSKDTEGGVLTLDPDVWAAMVSQIKLGAYDL
ncbi:DUF397 domain-containing protein [Actinomadura chokoriensis]|uniref:DUF397 domain-containing protein n=1 Tax=Actinomadura chokoriensis TaxID=454156 RepID=UPI0031F83727